MSLHPNGSAHSLKHQEQGPRSRLIPGFIKRPRKVRPCFPFLPLSFCEALSVPAAFCLWRKALSISFKLLLMALPIFLQQILSTRPTVKGLL